jgi:hypothetical protein
LVGLPIANVDSMRLAKALRDSTARKCVCGQRSTSLDTNGTIWYSYSIRRLIEHSAQSPLHLFDRLSVDSGYVLIDASASSESILLAIGALEPSSYNFIRDCVLCAVYHLQKGC